MEKSYRHPVEVATADIDDQGHVSNLVYVKWLQDAALAHSRHRGWPPERYRERGVGWVVRSHHIDYHKPAFRDDAIVIDTWIAQARNTQVLRKYRITRASDRAVLVTAETNWVLVDLGGTMRPRRIPEDLIAAFPVGMEPDHAEAP